MSPSILVVDDEPAFRVLAEEALASEGFEVRAVSTLKKARVELDAFSPDVIVVDRRLPDGDGIDFVKEVRATGPAAPLIVVVTAYAEVQNAVEALQAGAYDYLTKPVQLADLVVKLRKVLEARGMKDRLAVARGSVDRPAMVMPKSAAMRASLEKLESVAVSPLTPVLLMGPSGSGKQYAAERLHQLTFQAEDADAPFVEANCAALPEELFESELFGHEKGAFTDAKGVRRGLIEMAEGGTLFLDEVSEMPLRSQAKLLKFIDTMRFRRLGGQREIAVRQRLVAASNRDLRKLAETGEFREDLYHRLAVFAVTLPSLSERPEDIPELAQAFVRFFASRVKKRITGISPGALRRLAGYAFPGNVRELRNIIERAVILGKGPEIGEADIVLSESSEPRAEAPASAAGSAPAPTIVAAPTSFFSVDTADAGAPPKLDEVERAYVARVLEHSGGRRMAAAEALGISYPTFLKRLRELGLDEKAAQEGS